MKALAGYVMRGRMQAILVAAVATVLSVVLAPLSYLGAGVIALVTLRHGPLEGVVVAGGAGLVSAAMGLLVVGSALPALALLLSLWLPVWVLAILLKGAGSQGLVTETAGLMGVAVILLFHGWLDDPAEWWRRVFDQVLVPVLKQSGVLLEPEAVTRAASIMTGVVAAVSVLGILVAVYLGRWWQALLYNPGGFGEEFRLLRLRQGVALVTLVVFVASMVARPLLGTLGLELLMVAMILYVVQGLAVAHALVKQRHASVAWLVALYFLIVFLWPYALLLIGVTGYTDAWVDFRRRVGKA